MAGVWGELWNILRTGRRRKEPKVHIVSHPKCGRTWLRVLVGRAVCQQFGLNERLMLDTRRITSFTPLLPTTFDHDGTETGKRDEGAPAKGKPRFRNKKVILLVRDPRDVMVSFYFEATKRQKVYAGDLSQFIRDGRFGLQRCVQFHTDWWKNRLVPEAFTVIHYEDMRAHPQKALHEVLEFMGMANPAPRLIDEAVQFASFERMKQMEAGGEFQRTTLKPGDQRDHESFKVRKGKVGGYREYLSAADCRYMDEVIAAAQCPLFSRVVQSSVAA